MPSVHLTVSACHLYTWLLVHDNCTQPIIPYAPLSPCNHRETVTGHLILILFAHNSNHTQLLQSATSLGRNQLHHLAAISHIIWPHHLAQTVLTWIVCAGNSNDATWANVDHSMQIRQRRLSASSGGCYPTMLLFGVFLSSFLYLTHSHLGSYRVGHCLFGLALFSVLPVVFALYLPGRLALYHRIRPTLWQSHSMSRFDCSTTSVMIDLTCSVLLYCVDLPPVVDEQWSLLCSWPRLLKLCWWSSWGKL